jgi:hypothetical protein
VVPLRGAAQRAQDCDRGAKPRASIAIELTPSQIMRVFRDVGASEKGNSLIVRLGGDAAALGALLKSFEAEPDQKLSQSLVRGLYVLAILPDTGKSIGVLELAQQLEWSPGTLHRYLQTLVISGLAQRDEMTREYSRAF